MGREHGQLHSGERTLNASPILLMRRSRARSCHAGLRRAGTWRATSCFLCCALLAWALCLAARAEPIAADCDAVLLTGYWPPTNEMLRHFSRHPEQNPQAWQGADWRGLGYDVYAHFPEFPPDGDPTNDTIGEPGSVGAAQFDLPVDYQATSRDFWRLVDAYQPRILITTSRGGDIAWELEGFEGGHGQGDDPSRDWISDRFGAEHYPTRNSIEPRSWDVIATYRAGRRLPSALPLPRLLRDLTALDVAPVAVDAGTSGNYLSGFMGLHGLAYQRDNAHTVAAGHIHVGRHVRSGVARILLEATLMSVLRAYPPERACTRPVHRKAEKGRADLG